MDVLEAIKNRRAVRYFIKEKEIPVEILQQIISFAQKAPSWVDSQPWKVYIATGSTLEKIRLAHANNVDSNVNSASDWPTRHREDWDVFPQNNMALHNKETANYLYNDELKKLRSIDLPRKLYDAPAIAYLTIPKNSNQWSDYDLGAFAQTMCLAAQEFSVATMPAYEFVKYPDSVRKIMEIPGNELVAMGIGLGYPKEHMINNYNAPRVSLDRMLKILK